MATQPAAVEPVRWLPTDDRTAPETGVGLCLSGGGYRAMLFHLGVLWRLNELGRLPALDRIASVSGGSIVAGALALAWPRLAFGSDGVGRGFEAHVADPVLALAGHTLDVFAVLGGILGPERVGERLADFYAERLFADATLQDLPEAPRFVLCATNLASGELLRLSRRELADWRVGTVPAPRTRLADAVACSSAFPPVLSPFELDLRREDWRTVEGNDLGTPAYRGLVRLTDGGVYDNLGLETVWKVCRTVLVSDAGGQTRDDPEPSLDWPRQTLRVLKVVDHQVRSLRRRQVLDGLAAGTRDGAYWGIRSAIGSFGTEDVLPCPLEQTRDLARTPTRLASMDPERRERLVNWGYAVTDAALRGRDGAANAVPARFPFPASAV